MASRARLGRGLIGIGVLVIQTIALSVLRVPIGLQVAVVITTVIATIAGMVLAGPLVERSEDWWVRLAIGFCSGIIAFTAVLFVVFHDPIAGILGLDTRSGAAGFSLAIVVAAAGVVAVIRTGRRDPVATVDSGFVRPAVIALLSLGMAAATVYGVANTPKGDGVRERRLIASLDRNHPLIGSSLPEWGYRGDYYAHLVGFAGEVFDEGLPSDPVAHRGVQVWLLGEGLVFDPFDTADPVQAAKVLGAALWFALLTLVWHVARDALGAPPHFAWAAAVGAALFAPINLPVTELSRSSYRGLIHASGSMYHNYPQLIVVVLGAGAVAAVGVAARDRGRSRLALVSASVFASASFWFKPSLYLALGPALACVAMVLLHRRWRDLGLVVAVLSIPSVFWVAYPLIVGTPARGLGLELDPFGGYLALARPRLPGSMGAYDMVVMAAIVLFSFAAWAIPVGSWLLRSARTGALRIKGSIDRLGGSPVQLTQVVALTLGTAVAVLLVETGPDALHGNMKWTGSAAYVLAMPLLFALAAAVRSRIARSVTWVLVVLHLFAGGLHLWLYATSNQL